MYIFWIEYIIKCPYSCLILIFSLSQRDPQALCVGQEVSWRSTPHRARQQWKSVFRGTAALRAPHLYSCFLKKAPQMAELGCWSSGLCRSSHINTSHLCNKGKDNWIVIYEMAVWAASRWLGLSIKITVYTEHTHIAMHRPWHFEVILCLFYMLFFPFVNFTKEFLYFVLKSSGSQLQEWIFLFFSC